MEALVLQLCVPDTTKAATAELERLTKASNFKLMPELLGVLQSSQNGQARHMAGILLRQRVLKSWIRLPVTYTHFSRLNCITFTYHVSMLTSLLLSLQ